MAPTRRSLPAAAAHLGRPRLIQAAEQGQTVHITRRGKPVAVLVSKAEYTRLKTGTPQQDFWQAVQEWREQADFGWPELTPEEVDGWRDRSPGRAFSWDD